MLHTTTTHLILGDSLDVLPTLPETSYEAVITDPPYGIAFMGLKWDDLQGNQNFEIWCTQWLKECYRILVPGGMIAIFSSPRTHHRVGRALRTTGFQQIQCRAWCQTQGFPKTHDLEKALQKIGHPQADKLSGYGTVLKPSWEPIIIGYRPPSEVL